MKNKYLLKFLSIVYAKTMPYGYAHFKPIVLKWAMQQCNIMLQLPLYVLVCNILQHPKISLSHCSFTPSFHYSLTPTAKWHGSCLHNL